MLVSGGVTAVVTFCIVNKHHFSIFVSHQTGPVTGTLLAALAGGVVERVPLISGKSRLVKYYNLAR